MQVDPAFGHVVCHLFAAFCIKSARMWNTDSANSEDSSLIMKYIHNQVALLRCASSLDAYLSGEAL